MKVDMIIAGYQKCGTTALHAFLGKHPKVVVSEIKELDFFNAELNYQKGFDFYHSYFKKKPFLAKQRGFKFLEASPSYISDLNTESTAKRIYDYNNKAKVVALVRNPVSRCFSAWNMYKHEFDHGDKDWWAKWLIERRGKIPENTVRRTPEEYEDFDLFIRNEIKVLNEKKMMECAVTPNGFYYKGISNYQKVFGDNFRVIKNEVLNKETSKTLGELTQFFELPEIDWSHLNGVKVFDAKYKNTIQESTVNLLKEYFEDANKKLNELTGINYL